MSYLKAEMVMLFVMYCECWWPVCTGCCSFMCSVAASVVEWLACWPLVPKIAGSNPAEAVGFFRV
jgi:hypothetical protein